MPGVTLLRNSKEIGYKTPFQTVYFLDVRGLTTSSHIVNDYTISGHMDLWSVYVCIVYIEYIHLYTVYIHLCTIYLFISNVVKI